MRRAQAEAVMAQAIALARRGRGRTHPNPMVGAAVVREGRVIAMGHHARVGGPHAEVVALGAAGAGARGAEMVVTLEPCCHHGRTPPCTEAILRAGIRRVWVAMRDPFERVAGRGLRRLAAAGIEVRLGVGGDAAAQLNEAWLLAQARRRPFVTAKTAQSLDGRVACHTGRARWITSPAARRIGHRLRAAHDAVMVGVGTVLADDPLLTCRLSPRVGPAAAAGRRRPPAGAAAVPLRVVVDSGLRTPPTARLLAGADLAAAPVWLACGGDVAAARRRRLEAVGARVVPCPGEDGRVDLVALMAALYRGGVCSILAEGGPTLLGSLFDAQLVDRLYSLIALRVLGGARAPAAVAGLGAADPGGGWALESPALFAAGPDLGVTGRVVGPRRGRR